MLVLFADVTAVDVEPAVGDGGSEACQWFWQRRQYSRTCALRPRFVGRRWGGFFLRRFLLRRQIESQRRVMQDAFVWFLIKLARLVFFHRVGKCAYQAAFFGPERHI